jgi:hypothetical protein
MSSGTVGFPGRPIGAVPRGIFVKWATAATITVEPVGLDGKGYVPIWDGTVDRDRVWFDANITANLGSTGANGRHPDYTTEGNKIYRLHFIWGAADGLALLFVEDGDEIVAGTAGTDEVSIDDVTGGTFTHWSECCGAFLNNSSNNLEEFDQLVEGVFEYREITTELRVLNNGVATSGGTIDFTKTVPSGYVRAIGVWYSAANTISSTRSVYLYRKVATSNAVTPIGWNLANASGRCQNAIGATGLVGIGDGALTALLWYAWTGGAPTGGLTLYTMIFALKGY